MKAVFFTNITGEVFSQAWDSQVVTFKPGESRMMELGVAKHFARHLAIRECNKANKPAGKKIVADMSATYMSKEAVEAVNETDLETKILNANVKPKKEKKETKSQSRRKEVQKKEEKKEEEFPELK